MRLVIVSVGRVKERALRAALDEYLQRIRRYVACDELELADGPTAKLLPALAKATSGATVIALEVDGKALSSAGFAREIERRASQGKGVIAFVIGGADGIPEDFSRAAQDRWSLSSLTFPHRLARLVLVEQLYRTMTILRGEPYAH